MTKVRRKHLRRASTLLALLALVSLGIYAGRRALTRALVSATAELAPLTVRLEPRDFALNIAAKGELQSAEALRRPARPGAAPARRLSRPRRPRRQQRRFARRVRPDGA
jgi:hypothetical protein